MAAEVESNLQAAGNDTGEYVMAYSKVYYNTDAVIESPARNPVFTRENNTTVSDVNAPDLNSRELLTRYDEIKGLYISEKTPEGKRRLRKEAHSIKELIGEHRRKVFVSSGSLFMAITLLVILLQNIGLI